MLGAIGARCKARRGGSGHFSGALMQVKALCRHAHRDGFVTRASPDRQRKAPGLSEHR
jgi:hypothetical protein